VLHPLEVWYILIAIVSGRTVTKEIIFCRGFFVLTEPNDALFKKTNVCSKKHLARRQKEVIM
jgi:hypothetical protein